VDYDKLKAFRFWDTIDGALTTKTFSGKRRISLYPSEASVIAINKYGELQVVGKCLRAAAYRILGYTRKAVSIKSEYIFAFGHELESFICDLSKKAKVYNANSVKFFDQESSVSGEIDIVLEHPDGGWVIVECKSTYGYQNEKLLIKDNKPKDEHLLQILIYIYTHRFDPNLLGGKLVYILRDNMQRQEFDVTIAKEGDKFRAIVNGEVDKRFFIEDIYARFAELKKCVNENFNKTPDEHVLPDREYALAFTDAQMKQGFERGEVSKTAWEKFEKSGERCGNWNCSYCDFKDICWTGKDVEEYIGDTEIKVKPVRRRVTK